MEYPLKHPIKRVDGSTLTSVTLRTTHTLGDWLWIESNMRAQNDLERSALALCRFGGLARIEAEALDMDDYYGIMASDTPQLAKKEPSSQP